MVAGAVVFVPGAVLIGAVPDFEIVPVDEEVTALTGAVPDLEAVPLDVTALTGVDLETVPLDAALVTGLVDREAGAVDLIEPLLAVVVLLVFWPEMAPGTVRVSSQKPLKRTQVQST